MFLYTTYNDNNQEIFSEQVSKETKAQQDRIASGNDEAIRFAARIGSVRFGSIQPREFDSDDDISNGHRPTHLTTAG